MANEREDKNINEAEEGGALSQPTSLLPEKAQKKPLVQSAKDLFSSALGAVKGKDITQLVEDFTSEMTLVAEGLSEDQAALNRAQESLSAQQTLDQAETRNALDALHASLDDVKKHQAKLEKDLAALQKLVAEKKIKKVEGFTGLLRQATWLAGIAAGAWIIVTILKFFM